MSTALDIDVPGVALTPVRRRVPWTIAIAMVLVAIVLVWAVAGTLIAPHDPSEQDLSAALQSPSGTHLLGTDDSGRDILSRLIAGARAAVLGPLVIVLGAALLGTFFGLQAGYRGGWVDSVVMRGVDLLYALPGLLVAIVAVGVIGGGYWVAVAVLVLLTAPWDTRIIRGATLAQRSQAYVDAARTLGLSTRRIMFRHIWPNVLPVIVATSFLNFAYSLVILAALSFLGLGAGPGDADWGRMLADNLQLIRTNPLSPLAPGIALVLTAVSLNLVGDWFFERVSDRGRAR